MKNVKITQEGSVLTIVVDTSLEFGKSASGKNITVASTEGNVVLEGGITVGLNVYKKGN
jgi:hypothetical protein